MTKKKIIIAFSSVLLLVIAIFITLIFSFDHRVQNATEKSLNSELTNKDYSALRKQSDNYSYNFLKRQKHITVVFSADNQGSRNLAYYPVKINGKDGFGITTSFKNIFIPNPKIQEIDHYKN